MYSGGLFSTIFRDRPTLLILWCEHIPLGASLGTGSAWVARTPCNTPGDPQTIPPRVPSPVLCVRETLGAGVDIHNVDTHPSLFQFRNQFLVRFVPNKLPLPCADQMVLKSCNRRLRPTLIRFFVFVFFWQWYKNILVFLGLYPSPPRLVYGGTKHNCEWFARTPFHQNRSNRQKSPFWCVCVLLCLLVFFFFFWFWNHTASAPNKVSVTPWQKLPWLLQPANFRYLTVQSRIVILIGFEFRSILQYKFKLRFLFNLNLQLNAISHLCRISITI